MKLLNFVSHQLKTAELCGTAAVLFVKRFICLDFGWETIQTKKVLLDNRSGLYLIYLSCHSDVCECEVLLDIGQVPVSNETSV